MLSLCQGLKRKSGLSRWLSSRGPLVTYDHLVTSGNLRPDERQQTIVRHLDELSTRLSGYRASNVRARSESIFTKVSNHVHDVALAVLSQGSWLRKQLITSFRMYFETQTHNYAGILLCIMLTHLKMTKCITLKFNVIFIYERYFNT